MNIPTYNREGKNIGTTEVSDRIFAARWNGALVKQVYDGEQANRRKPWAHVKDRSEVRGGGKKPWKQKGLGRARHGSIRSPLWVGGGITHGPRSGRDYSVKINKKMKNASLKAVLARKLKESMIVLVDQFSLKNHKTKEAVSIFYHLEKNANMRGLAKRTTALLMVPHHEGTIRAIRNIPHITYTEPRNINTSALLHNAYVVCDVSAVQELEKILK